MVVVKAQDMRGMSSGSTATTSVSINIIDINDNLASFVQSTELSHGVACVDNRVPVRFFSLIIVFHSLPGSYELQVPENHRVRETIGTLELEDRDQIQNKEPIFSLPEDVGRLFSVVRSPTKDASLVLNKVRRTNPIVCHFKTKIHEIMNQNPEEYLSQIQCKEKFPVQHQPTDSWPAFGRWELY